MTGNSLAVIIVAGGTGTRMGTDVPKQFLKIGDREIIEYTLDSFVRAKVVDKIFVVCHKDYMEHMGNVARRFCQSCEIEIVAGGETRQESVCNGLEHAIDYEYVMIHDAVRCCIKTGDIINLYSQLSQYKACAFGVRVKDTIKRADTNLIISETVDRDNLWQIQTPQAFVTKEILALHKDAGVNNIFVTDDCALAEKAGINVKIIEGSYDNIKITTPEDIGFAEIILKRQ